MSSAQNQYPQPPKPPKPPTPPEAKRDAAARSSSEPPSSAETIMDQHPESTLIATPPAPPTSSEVMTSTASSASNSTPPVSSSASTSEEPASLEAASAESVEESVESVIVRQHPIPPASEPMQYRAIGLVRGRYIPSEEQFTRGSIQTEEEVPIDAVLLGRVMSLVKKHLDLEQPHLWVVYPRTREKGSDLHVQIVGVWEPEKLNRIDEDEDEANSDVSDAETDTTAEAAEETVAPEPMPIEAFVPASELDDRYFSIRGEIVYQSIEEKQLMVKIRRSPRQGSDESKAFKIALTGTLEGKALGHFWDLHVQRQGNELVVQEGTLIGMVPPSKRKGGQRPTNRRGGPPRGRGGPGGGKRWGGPPREGGQRSYGGDRSDRGERSYGGDRPQGGDRRRENRPSRPPQPRSGEGIAKPIIKRRERDNNPPPQS